MTVDQKPLPKVSPLNRPYFTAGLDGRFVLQRCQSCQQWVFYPRVACPHCLSMSLQWQDADGTGEIQSFAVVQRPQHESFMSTIPIILVAVKLPEGPIVISSLVDCQPEEVRIGKKVVVVFERLGDELALPRFRLADP